MPATADLLVAFELHSPDGIRKALTSGASATEPTNGQTPIQSLIRMYTRSSRFAECLQILLHAGAVSMTHCLKRCSSTSLSGSPALT